MKHLGHKISAIALLLAVFMLPVYLARHTAQSHSGHAYLDAAGLHHLRSNAKQPGNLHADVMESVSDSVGLQFTAQ